MTAKGKSFWKVSPVEPGVIQLDIRGFIGCQTVSRGTVNTDQQTIDAIMQAVADLSKAYALAVPADESLRIRDDVGFFQAVRAVLAKPVPGEAKPEEDWSESLPAAGSGSSPAK